ncbi:MAG: cobalt transport protein CbiN [Clostridia bacterium]
MKKSNKTLAITLLVVALLIIISPLIFVKDSEFGGSDGAGSDMVYEIEEDYEAWFTPVIETYLGGELSGELESLLFCVQTGIGVGIIAFIMGRFVERKKWTDKKEEKS